MNSVYCEWCEKEKKETVCIWVEKGMDEYCHLCHQCAISYYEDQIMDLKCDLIVNELEEEKEKEEAEKEAETEKGPVAITGTHCF